MHQIIEKNSSNAILIRPYLGGEEVTTHPSHMHHRFAIDLFDRPLCRSDMLTPWSDMGLRERAKCVARGVVPLDFPGGVAEEWPALLDVLRHFVKPLRDVQKRPAVRQRWWQYADKRPGLYAEIQTLSHVIVVNCGATPHFAFARLSANLIYAHTLAVFAFDTFAPFASLQARVHEVWTRFFASSMKDDLRYTPSDCFETFPFPEGFETDAVLEVAGQTYHDHRAALMVARSEGMTKTYNRFHDRRDKFADIISLRELHAEMDRVVLRAYGWDDLAERAEAHFLDETNEDDHTYQGRLFWPAEFRDEVLARLLALNAERAAAERAAGIVPRSRRRAEEPAEPEEAWKGAQSG
jgi:hypothetical protein